MGVEGVLNWGGPGYGWGAFGTRVVPVQSDLLEMCLNWWFEKLCITYSYQ